MSNQYAKGDTVYLKDGTECEFVHQFDNQYLVYLISSRDYNEEPIIDPIVVQEIFPEPPIAVKNQEILNLNKEIEQKQLELRRLDHEIKSVQIEHKRYKQIVGKHKALEFVDSFLERRITHVFEVNEFGSINIKTFEEAFQARGSYDNGKIKLLSLFGVTGGDLQWRIHSYSHGGDTVEIIPFYSLETVIAYAQQKINEEAEASIFKLNMQRLRNLKASVEEVNKRMRLHLSLPEKPLEVLKVANIKELQMRKQQYLQEIDKIEEKLFLLSK